MKIKIQDISKSFGTLKVLDHVSLELDSHQINCLMSPSGSGKTTLLRILMGLEWADSGDIFVEDSNIFNDIRQLRCSAVFQEDRLCETFTPIENVMMVTGKLLTKAQIRQELCRLLPVESISRPVATLSGGMKRRTAICRALLAPFDLLLMDEPFTGLDEETKHQVITYVCEKVKKRLVLLTTHQEQDIKELNARLLQL